MPTRVESLLLQALPANVKRGLKGLRVTNALAYYNAALFTTIKGFKVEGKVFTARYYLRKSRMSPISRCVCSWQAFSA
jgi:hypothetical protein